MLDESPEGRYFSEKYLDLDKIHKKLPQHTFSEIPE